MARTTLLTAAVMVFWASLSNAQTALPRFYAGASTAADTGSRGAVPGGAVPSAGAVFGVRVTDAWHVEIEVERGFRTTTRTSEAIWVSFPPVTPPQRPTNQQIEDYGIRARWDRSEHAGAGWSALAMWRSREATRVNVGLLGGVSSRLYRTRVVRTVTDVSPLLDLDPAHPNLQTDDSRRRMAGTGLTGGVVILVRVTTSLIVAPEFRVTAGLITDDPYRVFRSGVRVMWGF